MFTFELAERLSGTGVTANALHPASLIDTKMVEAAFGYTMSTVEEGAEAIVRLAAAPDLEGVTGRYLDGVREACANRQAYDVEARNMVREAQSPSKRTLASYVLDVLKWIIGGWLSGRPSVSNASRWGAQRWTPRPG